MKQDKENKIETRQCFFQNLVMNLGTEKGKAKIKELNNPVEIGEVNAYKEQLQKMSQVELEEHVHNELLDDDKLHDLKKLCKVFDPDPTDDSFLQKEIRVAIAMARHHDGIIHLATLLIDRELIALPALGWVDDNEFEFHSTESHEGRGWYQDMVQKLRYLAGKTDVEFFSNRDYQVPQTPRF